MKKYIEILKRTQLFSGIEEEDIATMLQCLQAKLRYYKKGAFIFRQGERFQKQNPIYARMGYQNEIACSGVKQGVKSSEHPVSERRKSFRVGRRDGKRRLSAFFIQFGIELADLRKGSAVPVAEIHFRKPLGNDTAFRNPLGGLSGTEQGTAVDRKRSFILKEVVQ